MLIDIYKDIFILIKPKKNSLPLLCDIRGTFDAAGSSKNLQKIFLNRYIFKKSIEKRTERGTNEDANMNTSGKKNCFDSIELMKTTENHVDARRHTWNFWALVRL